jgi:hypothetical protein
MGDERTAIRLDAKRLLKTPSRSRRLACLKKPTARLSVLRILSDLRHWLLVPRITLIERNLSPSPMHSSQHYVTISMSVRISRKKCPTAINPLPKACMDLFDTQ